MSKHLRVFSLGVALLALLAIGSVSGRGVFAQESTATPSATTDDGTTTDKTTENDASKSDRDGGPSKRGGRSGHDGGMNKGGGFRAGAGLHVDSEALATFLGITTDELKTELRAGSSLAEVAEAHGTTREELRTYLIEQYTAGLDAIIDASPADSGSDSDGSISTPEVDATPAASSGLLA